MTQQEGRKQIVDYALDLKSKRYSNKDVALKLNAKGYLTLIGKEFTATTVSRMLHDTEYFINFEKLSTAPARKENVIKTLEQRQQLYDVILSLKTRGMTITEITNSLNDDGYTGVYGGRFFPTTVRNIINNPSLLLFQENNAIKDKVQPMPYCSDEKVPCIRVCCDGSYVIRHLGEVLKRETSYKKIEAELKMMQ